MSVCEQFVLNIYLVLIRRFHKGEVFHELNLFLVGIIILIVTKSINEIFEFFLLTRESKNRIV